MITPIEVRPYADHHAIELMALAVEWSPVLSPAALAAAKSFYESSDFMKAQFPKVESLRGVSVQIDNESANINVATDAFQVSAEEPLPTYGWSVSVRPDILSVVCSKYSGWTKVRPFALAVLTPFVNLLIKHGGGIQAIGLQYQDSFQLATDDFSKAAHRLFATSTPWLPRMVWEAASPWHAHQGWFSLMDDERNIHNLLNIDALNINSQCVVRVNGQHRALAVRAFGGATMPIKTEDFSMLLDNLHHYNKVVLSGLLSPSVCSQINLAVES
jgi:uncharacterized protein (TIGR04255 family)